MEINTPSAKTITEEGTMAPPLTSVLRKPAKVQKSSESQNPQAMMVPMSPAPSVKEFQDPVFQNVVSTLDLSIELDLTRIAMRTRNSEYNPARFTGVIMRILNPRATALIFRSGKLVCTGSKSEEDSYLASRKFARIIQKLGFPVRCTNFKIQNIVATVDLKFPIRLESLNSIHGNFCTYEPELYPGLIYRMVSPRVVFLIFVNGKIVLTGAKRRSELKEAMTTFYPILKSFKK